MSEALGEHKVEFPCTDPATMVSPDLGLKEEKSFAKVACMVKDEGQAILRDLN